MTGQASISDQPTIVVDYDNLLARKRRDSLQGLTVGEHYGNLTITTNRESIRRKAHMATMVSKK